MRRAPHFPYAELVIDGRRYRRTGWFGCQLESMEWRRVPAGMTRTLCIDGGPFHLRVFRTAREGLRVRTSWSIPLSCGLDEANRRIYELDAALRRLI